jgi:hypothetical protein
VANCAVVCGGRSSLTGRCHVARHPPSQDCGAYKPASDETASHFLSRSQAHARLPSGSLETWSLLELDSCSASRCGAIRLQKRALPGGVGGRGRAQGPGRRTSTARVDARELFDGMPDWYAGTKAVLITFLGLSLFLA